MKCNGTRARKCGAFLHSAPIGYENPCYNDQTRSDESSAQNGMNIAMWVFPSIKQIITVQNLGINLTFSLELF